MLANCVIDDLPANQAAHAGISSFVVKGGSPSWSVQCMATMQSCATCCKSSFSGMSATFFVIGNVGVFVGAFGGVRLRRRSDRPAKSKAASPRDPAAAVLGAGVGARGRLRLSEGLLGARRGGERDRFGLRDLPRLGVADLPLALVWWLLLLLRLPCE